MWKCLLCFFVFCFLSLILYISGDDTSIIYVMEHTYTVVYMCRLFKKVLPTIELPGQRHVGFFNMPSQAQTKILSSVYAL